MCGWLFAFLSGILATSAVTAKPLPGRSANDNRTLGKAYDVKESWIYEGNKDNHLSLCRFFNYTIKASQIQNTTIVTNIP